MFPEGIAAMKLNFTQKVRIVHHNHGTWNTLKLSRTTWGDVEVGQEYIDNIDHVAYKMLDIDGNACQHGEPQDYNYDECVFGELKEGLMSEIGCITPYCGIDKENICTDYIKANQSSWYQNGFMGTGVLENVECMEACSYVTIKLTHVSQVDAKNESLGILNLIYQEKIQKIESYYIYSTLSLIAELGGYVGLFLGASVVQISEVIAFALRI